jgi:hypothetical protein
MPPGFATHSFTNSAKRPCQWENKEGHKSLLYYYVSLYSTCRQVCGFALHSVTSRRLEGHGLTHYVRAATITIKSLRPS